MSVSDDVQPGEHPDYVGPQTITPQVPSDPIPALSLPAEHDADATPQSIAEAGMTAVAQLPPTDPGEPAPPAPNPSDPAPEPVTEPVAE